MLTPEEVERRFADRGEMHDGALCLQPADALECVQVCERNDLAVIGVDTFISDEDRMVPQLHLVADFSTMSHDDWTAFRRFCNEETERFVSGLPDRDGLMITLSLAPAAAWGTF